MTFPVTFDFFGKEYNAHFIFETLAFFIAFRYYVLLKKQEGDEIKSINRLVIILGATIGALIGSRFLGILENPVDIFKSSFIDIYKSKTIIGGLIGGLISVEFFKKLLKEKKSSGDLFVFPLILGILIGRVGCFFAGISEPTYGIETTFFTGIDLGDGLLRHPTALYEILFLFTLFLFLKFIKSKINFKNGSLFKIFMILYFLFRFLIEFVKPNGFYTVGLSSIQIACLLTFLYYYKYILQPKNLIAHA
ncbi:prolipoprotein diacylglyceryl transferase family protein [Urechidicola croceus]|uniref:Diacylglyceryl transferase n=1 Tax=Urechidicola croceus TaxID=1850246 RepID=A0A1D8PAT9_9FLAO|nr:prolipoprotein diacylglyceryl transferase family protein [Urechidicola croceus]AOW21665.1 diacylglyceryl transferase [Urechidicola croceus]